MTKQLDDSSSEFKKLVDEFIDNTISDEDVGQLDRVLKESPAARGYFLRYVQMHIEIIIDATLEKRADGAFDEFCQRRGRIIEVAAPLCGVSLRRSPPHWLRDLGKRTTLAFRSLYRKLLRQPALVYLLGVLTATIFFQSIISVSQVPRANRESSSTDQQAFSNDANENLASTPVARLSYTNGCSWGGASIRPRQFDSQVRPGEEIVLYEGIAEFRLSSGISLSIEGPTALVVTSPKSFILQHGTITVHVPWSVSDFQMATGGCRLTTSDCEFGVRSTGGKVDIHAFTGTVSIVPTIGRQPDEFDIETSLQSEESEIPEGTELVHATVLPERGLSLASSGDYTTISKWHPADKSLFATMLTMAGRLPIANEYVRAVLDSKPIGYWRFENVQDGQVKNEVADAAPLEVGGEIQLSDDVTNHVAESGRAGARGYFFCREMFDLSDSDYSCEIWIKPSHMHTAGCVALLAELPVQEHEQLAFYLQVCGGSSLWGARQQQRIRFLHRSPPGFEHANGTSCYSKNQYSLRRWQHLVAVKEGSTMRLFVNGELTDEQHDATSLPSKLGMLVGQLGLPNRPRVFIGQFDELALYKHALSAEEIRRHFSAVNFTSDDWTGAQKSMTGNEGI